MSVEQERKLINKRIKDFEFTCTTAPPEHPSSGGRTNPLCLRDWGAGDGHQSQQQYFKSSTLFTEDQ